MYAAAPQGTYRLPPHSRNPGGVPPPHYHPVSVLPLTPPTPPRQHQRGQYTIWTPQIPAPAPAPQQHIQYPPGHHTTRHAQTQPTRQPRANYVQARPHHPYPRYGGFPYDSPFWKQGRNAPSATSTPATTLSYLTQESIPVTVPPRPQAVPIQSSQKKQAPSLPPVQVRPSRSRTFGRRGRERASSTASEVIIPPLLLPSAVPAVIPVNDRQARRIRKAMPTAGLAGLGAGGSRSRTSLPISEKTPVPSRRPTLRRSNSSVHFTPDHIFLSFSCLASASGSTSDTIDFKHAPATLDLKAIRSRVAPGWPYGMDIKDSRDDAASASGVVGPGESAVGMRTDKKVQERRLLRFYGHPWSARGEDGVAAKRVVCRLFASLAEQGYSYLSTLHGAAPTPTPSHPSHLIFTSAQPDSDPSFFAMSFSHSHKHITLVDAPKDVVAAVVNGIKNHVQGSTEGCWYTEGAYKLDLPGPSRSFLSTLFPLFSRDAANLPPALSQALQILSKYGYRLEASVLLGGETSFLGLRAEKKEVWVFRRVNWSRGGKKG